MIPIEDTYKYLGAHFADTFPSPKCWDYHANKVLKKADFAYHKCSAFLTNTDIPIDWRITNFSAMVSPMYGYASAIWWPSKVLFDKLVASYARKLRFTLGCETGVNMSVICTLCNIHDAEYWWELTRVGFKFNSLRKDVPGVHHQIKRLLPDNATGYTKWSQQEQHGVRMQLAPNERPTNDQIKTSMMVWERQHWNTLGTASGSRLDKDVLNWVLNDVHFQHLDAQDQVIPSYKKPRYRLWLRNGDFMFLAKTLGGGNNFLSTECICLRCGLTHRSWEHIMRKCPALNDRVRHSPTNSAPVRPYGGLSSNGRLQARREQTPDLGALSRSKKDCRRQVKLLRLLVRRFTPKRNFDMAGTIVRILEKGVISRYYITKKHDDGLYRCFDPKTKTTVIRKVEKQYREGKVFIETRIE